MLKRDYLYGYYVEYDDEVAYNGFTYLRDRLDHNEVQVFFNEASRRGRADFEDDYGRNYSLIKDDSGNYTIVSRD
ncbi:MAG TPA: hypothetical protein PLX73_02315 [Candidatus Paceibacterota bacterium]|nr:hypothetical protein [Candidatus Paceibacterota bacterium]HOL53843.1 hypothetical protein [Candidatus Paceibacterota bacterium]HON21913.1 hypothetical protein [Candidatus Paceibacterota bacterium]HPP17192.1 hypothetical protein [Candidatus Paceibacterota bacterium]HRU33714.1 hypothetical protein [Candidatus Paceibacterota bacterium]